MKMKLYASWHKLYTPEQLQYFHYLNNASDMCLVIKWRKRDTAVQYAVFRNASIYIIFLSFLYYPSALNETREKERGGVEEGGRVYRDDAFPSIIFLNLNSFF